VKRAVALSLSLLLLGLSVPAARAAQDKLDDLVFRFQLVPLAGQAPPVTLESLDGEKVSLAAFRGRPVLLYFWHST
jgi:cytochrome oxidase Cu insertion factor (SCO1/SenC/PrrC family)